MLALMGMRMGDFKLKLNLPLNLRASLEEAGPRKSLTISALVDFALDQLQADGRRCSLQSPRMLSTKPKAGRLSVSRTNQPTDRSASKSPGRCHTRRTWGRTPTCRYGLQMPR